MKRILRIFGWFIAIACIGVFGFFIFGIFFLGDRTCQINIRNDREERLIVKTFQYSALSRQLTVDSIVLANNEMLEIGHCIGCSSIDTLDLKFDAIGLYDEKMEFKVLNQKDLIDYLRTKEKVECSTYVLK